jgi:AbrB family looped-hinge helix DNA binding protein
MTTVTVSPKFQVVIPQEVRERLGLKPGMKLRAQVLGNHIALVPVVPLAALRGFARGVDTDVPRDEPDRV